MIGSQPVSSTATSIYATRESFIVGSGEAGRAASTGSAVEPSADHKFSSTRTTECSAPSSSSSSSQRRYILTGRLLAVPSGLLVFGWQKKKVLYYIIIIGSE